MATGIYGGMSTSAQRRRLLPRLAWQRPRTAPWLAAGAAVVLALGKLFSVFGLPPISTMGPMYSIGIVSPTCGLTRSVTAIMSGQFALAWRFNPGGFLVVVALAAMLVRWAVGRTSGRWASIVVEDWRLPVAVVVVLTIALGINQQMNADFVMNGTL